MIKYADYFPKSMLYKFGVSPEKQLISENELSTLKSNATNGGASKTINSFYSTLKQAFNLNGSLEQSQQLNLNRRVASMLCDLDVISSVDKETYLSAINEQQEPSFESNALDTEPEKDTRVSLDIEELSTKSANKSVEKSERVAQTPAIQLDDKGIQK